MTPDSVRAAIEELGRMYARGIPAEALLKKLATLEAGTMDRHWTHWRARRWWPTIRC
jgi:hypothetical protein